MPDIKEKFKPKKEIKLNQYGEDAALTNFKRRNSLQFMATQVEKEKTVDVLNHRDNINRISLMKQQNMPRGLVIPKPKIRK